MVNAARAGEGTNDDMVSTTFYCLRPGYPSDICPDLSGNTVPHDDAQLNCTCVWTSDMSSHCDLDLASLPLINEVMTGTPAVGR